MEKSLLLVVDVQNGFMQSKDAEAILPKLNSLLKQWKSQNLPIVFSRFINKHSSPYVKILEWDGMMDEPDTDLYKKLDIVEGEVYDKTTYSAWSDEMAQICHASNVGSVIICGVDTDQCVLATALAIFDSGLRPVVVTDACASDAGTEYHDAGLKILERLIGAKQLVSAESLLY